ncbi:shikimate dehydrogenase family protein [Nigerium massiliense]|uniref:shikimate dehydrogenase family protein n=1 Tax=Nigerium massiliense TaxID=1522317 RepID=UPI00058F4A40|nr:hypothetical protein [Nigerium massiliense]
MTHRCAVLGSPIAHSLSPVLHRTAYELLGLTDWTFDRFEMLPDDLPGFIADCGPEWVGLACTAPLKERLVTLGEPSERARQLASGNTYLFGRGGARPQVHNTDVTGMVAACGWRGITSATSAILLGAGATARSSLLALAMLGVREITVLARDAGRALGSLAGPAARFGQTLEVLPWGTTPGRQVDLVVNTVPTDLEPSWASGLVALARGAFDAVYSHGPSPLRSAADAAGRPSLDGLDLLVGQGIEQLKLMTGRDCPPEPLVEACRREYARRRTT